MTDHDRLHVLRRLPCAAILIASLGLAACGGSSKGTATAGTPGPGNRAKVAACLKQQGITLPSRRGGGPGGGPPGGGQPGGRAGPDLAGGGQPGGRAGPDLGLGGPPGGGPSNPNRTKLRAALRKCGVNFRGRRFSRNPAARQAYVKFAACVRRNGYNLPPPNTTGNGPVFNRGQVNPNDPKFKAAATKCQALLPQRPANGPPGGQ